MDREPLREKNAVSFLDRFTDDQHLSDDVLAEIWSAATAEGGTGSHPHLAVCAECRARYAEFTRWLENLRDDAFADADLVMSPERLSAQQTQILRRLETLERPARVIAFPASARPAVSTARGTQRWVAAAAAAGLVIGVAAGQLVDLRRALQPAARPGPVVVDTGAQARPGNGTPVTNVIRIDEAFLYGDIEASARNVQDSSLRAFDTFTPRARDIDR
jgi:hypothetical protein